MMEKLQQAQQDIENKKQELEKVSLEEKSPDKSIEVEITANGKIKGIRFSKELNEYDPEELEDLLVITLNKAISRAEEIKEKEMAMAAKNSMPNIPGLF
ncbi:MAG: YbaB/EbfC family nucleoid-associated protein [Flavobacteriales bacterium]|nr:YbaB/EbfC family nucleoid-associated protein [Flavobacteriales bacterium]